MKKIILLFALFIYSNLFANAPIPSVGQTWINAHLGIYKVSLYTSWSINGGSALCTDPSTSTYNDNKSNFYVRIVGTTKVPNYPAYCYTSTALFEYNKPACIAPKILQSDGTCGNECPDGKIKDASGLYCVPSICPIGSTRDPHTLHCLPIKCPPGQTLISDGTCQITCPPNSVRVNKICRYTCGHWSKDLCGKYLDPFGNKCKWSYGNLLSITFSHGSLGSCVTEDQSNKDIEESLPLKLSPTNLQKIFAEPIYPDYEPQPLKPYEPQKPIIPKPINDPEYTPPIEPAPIEPIPLKPIEPAPKPANDPDYIPTIEPVIPLTPDIVPYAPPVPAPVPEPVPEPAPFIYPEIDPIPLPPPAPFPEVKPTPSPAPAPAPAPVPLPMPKPDYTYDPVPETPPVIDPVTGEPVPAPAPSTVPDVNMPNVNMPPIPDILDFSIDDMDKFRYNATTMSYNILDQVDNVQNTFTNTMNILNNGFPPVVLPSGSCGSSMSFGFYGKEIDLCPPLANTSAQFAPLFQLLIFLVGLIASIKIFMIGLRD